MKKTYINAEKLTLANSFINKTKKKGLYYHNTYFYILYIIYRM